MAERLTLARLEYDDAPLAKGEKAVEQSSKRMQGSMQVLGQRMFSLRTVALRLGTAIGVAGAAFAAIRAVMRVDVVQAFTAEFGKLATNFATAFIEGSRLGGVLRTVTDWMKGANDALNGPESLNDALKRMNLRDPREQIADLVQLLGRVNREAEVGALPFYFKQIGEQAAALKKQFPGLFIPGMLAAVIPPEAAKTTKKPKTPADVMAARGAAGFIFPEEVFGGAGGFPAAGAIADLSGQMALLNEQATITRAHFEDIFDPDTWERLTGEIHLASVNMEIMATATEALGRAIATSLLEGGKGMRDSIARTLKDLAVFYSVQAIAQIAMGIAASTPWGQALGMGRPEVYFSAAAKFGLAAGAAGAGAAALGGSGGGLRGGGGGGGGGLGRGGGSRNQSFTFIFNGAAPDDPDAYARQIVKRLRTAKLDGAEF